MTSRVAPSLTRQRTFAPHMAPGAGFASAVCAAAQQVAGQLRLRGAKFPGLMEFLQGEQGRGEIAG
jgi:hypothetical protein